MYIICILATIFFLIGGMISYFVFKSKKKEESSTENLDIKNKYEKRLKDANLECDKLQKQLGDALNGKLEDSIKDQLQEVDVLKKKIRNLEDEIEENEDDISDLRKK
jgi:peptidoglycan hydrolase CwlO-like protein